jgi:predicted house-cleaning NTP pyrophosphatase (Maf/HAM1 superfamily)
MQRTTKNKILAIIALFAIFFSVVSTAILVIMTQITQAPSQSDLEDILNSFSWTKVQVATWETLSWTTK